MLTKKRRARVGTVTGQKPISVTIRGQAHIPSDHRCVMELIIFFIKKKGEIEKQKQKAKKKAHIGFCGRVHFWSLAVASSCSMWTFPSSHNGVAYECPEREDPSASWRSSCPCTAGCPVPGTHARTNASTHAHTSQTSDYPREFRLFFLFPFLLTRCRTTLGDGFFKLTRLVKLRSRSSGLVETCPTIQSQRRLFPTSRVTALVDSLGADSVYAWLGLLRTSAPCQRTWPGFPVVICIVVVVVDSGLRTVRSGCLLYLG